ncbi:MAG: FAD-dependent oxidoreductase, partial [Proteiniphilum sp.]|nr:FAD-dependent oxidoreductase [Proteiniphilum sp.]
MEKRTFILFMILGGLLSFSGMKAEKYIPPHHPAIHYSGRVDRSNQDTVRFDWPGVSVQCRFSGKSIGIRINGGKDNHFNLFLDGELISIFRAPRDTTITIRPLQRKKTYELLLTKRTEADMGMARFMGIVLDDHGELYPLLKTPNRRIEFIGNSITCGYGTEGSCKEERFTPGTENNYQSYAAILARAFSAEAHFIAHSGKGVVRNYGDKKPVSDAGNTMPGCYNRTLDNNPARIWDFSSWKPDCVVINLGTNDFSTTPHPDKHTFLKGYRELLSRIRQNYGNIPVFCVAGPMINEPCFSYVKEFTLYCRNAEQDHQIFFAGLPDHLLNQAEDLGSDWHPSYKGQLKIAAQLLTPIATVMNWDYHNDEIHPCENDTKRHEQQKTSHPILAFETPGCTHIQSPDVLIVGGGTSGVSAGISSARAGVQTMILEESEWLGGMLTSAGVSAIDGNYNLPSGFWGEFKDSLTSYYGNAEALKTGWVSHVQFEPSAGNSILQQITAHEKNLTVHFKSKLKSIKKGNGQWTVLIETPGRTLTLHPKIIIDATELGDIALQCGVRYDVGMESRGKTREDVAPEKANDVIQDLTYVAILKDYGKDVTIPQPAGYNPHEFACSCENPLCENPNPLNTLWAKDKMITYGKLPNNKYMINWPIEGNDYYANLIDKNEMEREEVLRKAKNHTLCFLYFIQKELGMNTLGLADDEFPTEDKLPWIPYYRESLRIHGLVRFTLNHILSPYTQPDKLYRTCIAVGDYPVDHHHGKYPAWET